MQSLHKPPVFEEPRRKQRGIFDRKEFYHFLIARNPRGKPRGLRALLRFKSKIQDTGGF